MRRTDDFFISSYRSLGQSHFDYCRIKTLKMQSSSSSSPEPTLPVEGIRATENSSQSFALVNVSCPDLRTFFSRAYERYYSNLHRILERRGCVKVELIFRGHFVEDNFENFREVEYYFCQTHQKNQNTLSIASITIRHHSTTSSEYIIRKQFENIVSQDTMKIHLL